MPGTALITALATWTVTATHARRGARAADGRRKVARRYVRVVDQARATRRPELATTRMKLRALGKISRKVNRKVSRKSSQNIRLGRIRRETRRLSTCSAWRALLRP